MPVDEDEDQGERLGAASWRAPRVQAPQSGAARERNDARARSRCREHQQVVVDDLIGGELVRGDAVKAPTTLTASPELLAPSPRPSLRAAAARASPSGYERDGRVHHDLAVCGAADLLERCAVRRVRHRHDDEAAPAGRLEAAALHCSAALARQLARPPGRGVSRERIITLRPPHPAPRSAAPSLPVPPTTAIRGSGASGAVVQGHGLLAVLQNFSPLSLTTGTLVQRHRCGTSRRRPANRHPG